MRNGVVIRHRPVAGHVIASPRPLAQLPLGSEKMAKVSELYDVTWEGNCGRVERGKTKPLGSGSGDLLLWESWMRWSVFGTRAPSELGEPRWWLRWRWRLT